MDSYIGCNAIILEPISIGLQTNIGHYRIVSTIPSYRTKHNKHKYTVFVDKKKFNKYIANRLCFCLLGIDINKL